MTAANVETYGFFDRYPRFYSTSAIGSSPHRLNWRYRALVAANIECVRGRRILDIASHDGRWSLAAVESGAAHVTGIEPRARLVREATAAMAEYGVDPARWHYLRGDAHEVLADLTPGQFDTVFCFGFLYHTVHHLGLLSAVARLRPEHLIVDTRVIPHELPMVELKEEDSANEANAIDADPAATGRALVGVPSRPALDLLLRHAGYGAIRYFDWCGQGITDWSRLAEYRDGGRVSLTVSRPDHKGQ